MAAAGAPDGSYTIGGMAVRVERGVAQLADGSSIAGSTLTTAAALRTAAQAGLSVPDAVRALSTTPAAALGLATVGAIRPGLDADLVVLEPDLAVHRVMAKGRWAERD